MNPRLLGDFAERGQIERMTRHAPPGVVVATTSVSGKSQLLLTTSDVPRPRKQLRRLVPLALVVALAGCSQPGKVTHYNSDTQSNYVDTCVAARDASLTQEQAQGLCTCWYNQIVATVPFDKFKSESNAIRDAVDNGTLNTSADFQNIAPNIAGVVNGTNCVVQ